MLKLTAFLLLTAGSLVMAQEPALNEITYTESDDVFPNPERGWYLFRELPDPWSFDIRGEDKTLIYGRISADDFKDRAFSQDFLDAIQEGFDLARENGIKVNPRVAYNSGPEPDCPAQYGCDAPMEIVKTHIAQLAPLWKANADVINVLDPGFIGGWGEWHTSSNSLDTPEKMKEIMFAILDSLPETRMVYIRYPAAKREIFGGSKQATEPVLDSAGAFTGTRLSRIGHLNDCFLSSDDDVGTYQYGWSRKQNLDYIGAESPYTPYGGETCAVNPMGECENTLYEMEKLHINHLNHDYHEGVIGRWQDDGCYDEITRRMGYRFVLRSALLPDEVKPGGILVVHFDISNVGWGELFNPRDVEVVLMKNSTSQVLAAVITEEPRFWGAGKTVTVTSSLAIPTDIEEGEYTVGIRLPDKYASIRDDYRYAVRFANKGVWNEDIGTNILKDDLSISASAPGAIYETFTEFMETGGISPIVRKLSAISNIRSGRLYTLDGKFLFELKTGERERLSGLKDAVYILHSRSQGIVKVVKTAVY